MYFFLIVLTTFFTLSYKVMIEVIVFHDLIMFVYIEMNMYLKGLRENNNKKLC